MSTKVPGARLCRQADQVGMDQAKQWVALTDDGKGLDDFWNVHFSRVVRILDYFQTAEHLGEFAKACLGGDASAAEALTQEWSHQMKDEGCAATLATLEALDLKGLSSALAAHRLVTCYVRNNLHCIDYLRHREEGSQIGSGQIEAACKTVVHHRLKRSGMRWSSD